MFHFFGFENDHVILADRIHQHAYRLPAARFCQALPVLYINEFALQHIAAIRAHIDHVCADHHFVQPCDRRRLDDIRLNIPQCFAYHSLICGAVCQCGSCGK